MTQASLTVKIRWWWGGRLAKMSSCKKVSATLILHSLEHAGVDVLIKLLWRWGKGNFNLTTHILKCFSPYKMEIEC